MVAPLHSTCSDLLPARPHSFFLSRFAPENSSLNCVHNLDAGIESYSPVSRRVKRGWVPHPTQKWQEQEPTFVTKLTLGNLILKTCYDC